MWKNTRKVGFAFAFTESGQFYVVINYFPAGNIKNEFSDNVLPIGKAPAQKISEPLLPRANIDIGIGERAISRAAPPYSEPAPPYSELAPLYSEPASKNLAGFNAVQSRFIQEALTTHNICRQRHCVEPVSLV